MGVLEYGGANNGEAAHRHFNQVSEINQFVVWDSQHRDD